MRNRGQSAQDWILGILAIMSLVGVFYIYFTTEQITTPTHEPDELGWKQSDNIGEIIYIEGRLQLYSETYGTYITGFIPEFSNWCLNGGWHTHDVIDGVPTRFGSSATTILVFPEGTTAALHDFLKISGRVMSIPENDPLYSWTRTYVHVYEYEIDYDEWR